MYLTLFPPSPLLPFSPQKKPIPSLPMRQSLTEDKKWLILFISSCIPLSSGILLTALYIVYEKYYLKAFTLPLYYYLVWLILGYVHILPSETIYYMFTDAQSLLLALVTLVYTDDVEKKYPYVIVLSLIPLSKRNWYEKPFRVALYVYLLNIQEYSKARFLETIWALTAVNYVCVLIIGITLVLYVKNKNKKEEEEEEDLEKNNSPEEFKITTTTTRKRPTVVLVPDSNMNWD
jgi:hypothetical protein